MGDSKMFEGLSEEHKIKLIALLAEAVMNPANNYVRGEWFGRWWRAWLLAVEKELKTLGYFDKDE